MRPREGEQRQLHPGPDGVGQICERRGKRRGRERIKAPANTVDRERTATRKRASITTSCSVSTHAVPSRPPAVSIVMMLLPIADPTHRGEPR